MYQVLKELLELSNKADKIIENSKLSDENLDDMFLYAKSTMRQIMNGNFPKYDSLPFVGRKKSERKCISRPSYGINLKNKSQVLAKPHLSPAAQTIESNDSGVVFVLSSDTEQHLTCKHEIDNKNFDESDQIHILRKPNFEECENLMAENHSVVPSVFCTDGMCSSHKLVEPNKKPLNFEAESITEDIDMHESKEITTITPKNDKNFFDFEEVLQKRRRTRSLTNYCSRMGISLDGSFHQFNSSTENKGILDKTYVLSSSSSAEDTKISLNKTYVISSTSSEENNECTVILKDGDANAKGTTATFITSVNDREKLRRNHDKQMKSKMLRTEEKSTLDEKYTCVQNTLNDLDKIENNSILLKENSSNLPNFKSKNALKVQFSAVQCDDIESLNDKVNDIKEKHHKNRTSHFQRKYKIRNNVFSDKSSNFEQSNNSKNVSQHINKNIMSTSCLDRRKYSSSASSSDDTIPSDRKITKFRNFKLKKEYLRQFQTNSAPVCRRQLKNHRCRPATPLGFNLDCTRQSLKDKAEEKRKNRETRVQKAKERRENLERENEEKIRLNEQRLKQRLEQHEKLLRQKVNKFRMKLRNQQQWNTRRYHSSTSTSSEDSKEGRAKDNGVCRNVQESSQQLSKVGNLYHDMALKKDAPNSLQGNVGQSPEVSKKHNSNVSCERTPVDLLTNTDVTKTEKIKRICENTIYVKKYDASNCFKSDSPEDFIVNSGSKMKSGVYNFQNSNITKSDQKQFKRNIDDRLNKTDSVINQLKSNEECKLLMEQGSNSEDLKRSAYFLRSLQKDHLNSTLISAITEKAENGKKNIENCKNVVVSSESEKCGCSYSCFSSTKPKNDHKNSIKMLANSRSSILGKKKRYLIKPKKGMLKKKKLKGIPKKIINITSYKISDMHENSFDESKVDPSDIPLWAKGLYLRQALIQQYYKPLNVEKIFGVIPREPIDLGEIFQIDKPEYHRRTSSEKWSMTDTST